MRVLAFALALSALTATGSAGAAPGTSCPHAAASVAGVRAGMQHVRSLETCSDRVTGHAKPAAGRGYYGHHDWDVAWQ